MLFSKFTWADRATKQFREKLHHLAIKDPYGDYYVYQGYQYQTGTQLLDINTKRLIPMCFLSAEYLEMCKSEFKKTLDLGADGILYDECQHHGQALLCFDLSHGYRYGAPVYANDRYLIELFREMAAGENRSFCLPVRRATTGSSKPTVFLTTGLEQKSHSLMRYLRPEAQLMTAITGFADRNMINQCLLYRYVISYEPYHFKGMLGDFPATVEYGAAMDALRSELRSYLWDGEFRDTVGAIVRRDDGSPHHPYSVFQRPTDRKRAVVVANYDEHEARAVSVTLAEGGVVNRYRTVEDRECAPLTGRYDSILNRQPWFWKNSAGPGGTGRGICPRIRPAPACRAHSSLVHGPHLLAPMTATSSSGQYSHGRFQAETLQ